MVLAMSIRTIVVLILAIICGVSSAAGVFMLRGPITEAEIATVPVVVAARDISRGAVVSTDQLTTQEWPADLVPANVIADISLVAERTAVVPITAGEPILGGKVTDSDSGRGLAALIPSGRRAYTIQTSSVGSNVAGFVLPGNRVDVLLTLRGGSEDTTGGGSSTTLLQAVEILAVDQKLDAPSGNPVEQLRSVTLLVTPEQASLLDLGHNMGTLALSLRNPSDISEADTKPATVNVLRFTQQEPVADTPSDAARTATSSLLATAAATAAKAILLGTVNAAGNAADSKDSTRKPQYLQAVTLRGRHSGRIVLRAAR